MDINFLELNISALRNNISIIKQYTQTKFCLPVKANAYGHGLQNIVKNTRDIVDFYATACAAEALKVYKNSFEVPILVFGVVESDYIEQLIRKDIRISVHNLEDIIKIENHAKHCSRKAKVHVFVNTGMNMLGVDYEQAKEAIKRIRESRFIVLEGVYSHLACADEQDHTFNRLQIQRFQKLRDFVNNLDYKVICHLANSYGCIGQENIAFDMVRPGILSYGFLPYFEVGQSLQKIQPIAKLTSQVIKIIRLDNMPEVGYSISYIGEKGEYIAIAPVGYGDGFPRELGNSGVIYIKNKKYPIVGRVNMDALAISLGDNVNNIKEGNIVELISDVSSKPNSAKNIAKKLDTIEYDIIATLNGRVIRKEV